MPNTDPDGARTPDPQVVALGRTVERTARRVGDLDTLLAQLAADVTALARIRTPAPAGDGGDGEDEPEVRSWLLAAGPDGDPEQARADLADLVQWLGRVFLRYPGAALPSCWLWHPAVVEELWWLRGAHADAYDPEAGSWLRVGDWHDRQLPGVLRRLTAAVGGCELALHVDGAEQARPPAVVPLAGYADALADSWISTGTSHAPPPPNPTQLDEAQRHDRAQHRQHP